MKKIILSFCLLLVIGAKAQVIDSVKVDPATPITSTPVNVYIYTYFTTLTSFVSVNTYTLSGNVFQVDLVRCQGPLTALDYPKDTVAFGLLPAGTYTVLVNLFTAQYDMQTGQCSTAVLSDSGSATFTVLPSMGITKGDVTGASVYYSQMEESVIITSPHPMRSCKFTLLDISGKVVMQEIIGEGKSTRVKTAVPPGLYFISLDDGKARLIKKVAIN